MDQDDTPPGDRTNFILQMLCIASFIAVVFYVSPRADNVRTKADAARVQAADARIRIFFSDFGMGR